MAEKTHTVLDAYPDYEATIGIEVHVQLKTQSKIFCACPNQFGQEPNKNVCQICAGHPGTLPTLNKKAVDSIIMAGLATNCTIATVSEFSRKHYNYPDLPKNYQITQGDKPFCQEGHIVIDLEDGSQKTIRIMRMHLEEDAGKNLHATPTESFVDLNRAGTPLIEIVTHPDIENAVQARTYLQRLRAIVQYLGISDANMEEGSFRGDINISVKKKSAQKLGTRVEMKNINSFKFITQAIEYEIQRQIEKLEAGGTISQETRLWDTKDNKTVVMRSKENAQDYRYLTDPDLPVVMIDKAWLKRLKAEIPELPHEKLGRFQSEYNLSLYEAEILSGSIDLAQYFENTVKACKAPKQVSNWILRDLLAYMNEHKLELEHMKITPEMLGELIIEIERGVINSKIAQDVFLEMALSGKYPSIIIQEKDLKQIGNESELEAVVLEIIKANPDVVKDYLGGNQRVFAFFVGQAMKATKGKGNPSVLQELFKKNLK